MPDGSEAAPLDRLPETMTSLPASGEGLRHLLRRTVSPVVVVTALGAREARGATIGSFTSVSLKPPLVSFNVTRSTSMHRVMTEAERFAVHLLADDQAGLAAHFAAPDLTETEQFEAVPHHRVKDLPPLLVGTLGVVLCEVTRRVEVGDHTLMLGEVKRVLDGRDDAEPLLYHQQAYRGVGAVV